jgi:hypothetical protein
VTFESGFRLPGTEREVLQKAGWVGKGK